MPGLNRKFPYTGTLSFYIRKSNFRPRLNVLKSFEDLRQKGSFHI